MQGVLRPDCMGGVWLVVVLVGCPSSGMVKEVSDASFTVVGCGWMRLKAAPSDCSVLSLLTTVG